MKYFISAVTILSFFTVFLQAAQTNKESAPPAIRAKPVESPPELKPESRPEAKPAMPVSAGEIPVKAVRTSSRSLDQKGKIEKLDAEAGTFTVEGKCFTFSKHGKIYIDNVRKALSDLKMGDLVAVTFFEKSDGVNNATQIVKGYPHKKRKKKKASTAATKSDSVD